MLHDGKGPLDDPAIPSIPRPAMKRLEAAHAAFANYDWRRAHDDFRAARAEAPLAADDLASLREASWWLGLVDESLAAAEEAYTLYLEASDNRRAAHQAWEIAYAHFLKADDAVGRGWIGRVQRLLAEEGRSEEHTSELQSH